MISGKVNVEAAIAIKNFTENLLNIKLEQLYGVLKGNSTVASTIMGTMDKLRLEDLSFDQRLVSFFSQSKNTLIKSNDEIRVYLEMISVCDDIIRKYGKPATEEKEVGADEE